MKIQCPTKKPYSIAIARSISKIVSEMHLCALNYSSSPCQLLYYELQFSQHIPVEFLLATIFYGIL